MILIRSQTGLPHTWKPCTCFNRLLMDRHALILKRCPESRHVAQAMPKRSLSLL